jgi:hypothetical protein
MEVSNTEDLLDSRDIIARIKELELLADEEELDEGDRHDLDALRSLADEASGCADWEHGETLIRDSFFTEYAQEFAEDIGAISDVHNWPLYCIDWEQAARELQMDYMCVSYDGIDYWIPS